MLSNPVLGGKTIHDMITGGLGVKALNCGPTFYPHYIYNHIIYIYIYEWIIFQSLTSEEG